ncbi:hypothetical protein [Romboutsia sp. 1001713B170131_170501_G6]|uniref:hypothetical protein n=1 Tax=Romboutsia sp. 1001713B170131_170501_G6 TaxID=2787108 RepID=UPI0024343BC9|nr:hypothetical protein [Romboutsia sp. 1001713B170131_170501_G6]
MQFIMGCLGFLLILGLIAVVLKLLGGILIFMGGLIPIVGVILLLTGRLDRALQKLGGTRFKLNRIHGFVGIIIISMLSVQIGTSLEGLFDTDNTEDLVSKVDSVQENNETKVEDESEKELDKPKKEENYDIAEEVNTDENKEEYPSDIATDIEDEIDINQYTEYNNDEDESYTESKMNEGGTVYWTPNGKSYHTTSSCSTLSRSKTILSGTQSESGKYDPCDRCH